MAYRVESIFGDGITFEELWDIDLESIASKVVGEELSALISRQNGLRMKWIACTIIQKLVAEDVCQVDDDLVLGVIGFRSGDVCLDTVDLLIRP
jgi:hypothetical protein